MASYVLDKAYRVTDSGGVIANRAVVQGVQPGECKLPTAANEGAILGATVHGASQDQSVAVRKLGIASLTAAGAVSAGDAVCIADNQGRIKAAAKAKAETGVEGNNNAITWTAKKCGGSGNALIVDIVVSGNNTPLSIAVAGNTITINSATDGGGIATTTAAQAIAAIAAHANASVLISGANKGTSSGAGVLADETASFSGGELGDNAFGFAEESASASGDIIDVFLSL
ncbi:hypothetical protein JW926_00655 [Candidatus Sumerlaeota bacterium]|nr:hypothetical protein [Candidatus Sumerlaeota bacterium]